MTAFEIPSTMRAWRIQTRGRPQDVLREETIPVPALKPGEVLVKVEAAALNPVGYKVMQFAPNFANKRPRTAEHDFTGTIVAISPSLTTSPTSSSSPHSQFRVGSKVYGLISGFPPSGAGTLQEYLPIDISPGPQSKAGEISIRPERLSVEEASGAALAGLTSVVGLFDVGEVKDGDKVFVNGGSSACGMMAIQMLKAKGCQIGASCSTKNIALVKSLGADEVLDYTTSPIHTQLQSLSESCSSPPKQYDAIYDCVGSHPLYHSSPSYLKPTGIYVNAGLDAHSRSEFVGASWHMLMKTCRPVWLGGTRRAFRLIKGDTRGDALERLSTMMERGQVIPKVDSVFAWEDTLKAYERIMTNRATGKVVIMMPQAST